MATISGSFARVDSSSDANPTNGATATLWLDNASFAAGGADGVATYPPISGTAVPSTTTNRAATPVTTGTAYGGVGAYRFTGVAPGNYWVSLEYAGDTTVWETKQAVFVSGTTGTALTITPASGETVTVGSATTGAVAVQSNSTITIGNTACDNLVLIGGSGITLVQLVDLALDSQIKARFYDAEGAQYAAIAAVSDYTANRTYTLPEVSADADFVMTAGTQTIAGNKTLSGNNIHSGTADFSSTVDLNSTTGGLRLVASGANRIHGTGNLATGATTTVVSNTAVKTGAFILLMPTAAGFTTRDPYVSAISDSTSFTITHTNVASTPAFEYWILNPVA